MPKCKEKIEEIKIRLTPAEKKLIKDAAATKNITMTKFILDKVIPTAKHDIEVISNKDIIEDRAAAMESKIKNLKGTLECRRANKKNTLKSFFARKS